MAGQKISFLPDVATVLPMDLFILSRGNKTYKITGSAFGNATQIKGLSGSIDLKATKAELELVRSSFAAVSAANASSLLNIASTRTTTEYVNNEIEQTKVYINDKYQVFNNGLSAYIPKPSLPQVGNNLIWDGSNWIAQNPAPSTINNYLLDIASVGGVVWFAATTPPPGYLECDGSSLLRSVYPELFAAIGTTFGSVDSEHFNLPDLRGQFVRGWDHNKGFDSGRAFGSQQSDSMKSHTHSVSTLVDTTAYTTVDTDVDTVLDLNFDVSVYTNVATTVQTNLSTAIEGTIDTAVSTDVVGTIDTSASTIVGGTIDTSVYTSVSSDAITTIDNTTDTTVTTNVSVMDTTVDASLSTTQLEIAATYLSPLGSVPYATTDNSGSYDLSPGTTFALQNVDLLSSVVGGSATVQGMFELSSNGLAESTAVTLITSNATTTIVSIASSTAISVPALTANSIVVCTPNLTGTSTATSTPHLTANSSADSTAVSLATSTAIVYWQQKNAYSTAVSLATSTAFSTATSDAGLTGDGETRPSNIALLPCIKYTKTVSTVGLNEALSGYIPKPSSASSGQYLGFDGTVWKSVRGLPTTAVTNQFLKWDGSAWIAGDFPATLLTPYSTTFIQSQQRSVVEITNIPSTAKRITIVFSQININEGSVIKVRLGTALGMIASNYKFSSTAISSVGQKFLNTNDSFGLFGAISYTSVIPNALTPANQTVVSRFVDSTVTLTKTESNNWVFANTGSVDVWSMFGGGSINLPAVLDRLAISVNTGQFLTGNLTVHWE